MVMVMEIEMVMVILKANYKMQVANMFIEYFKLSPFRANI